LGSRLFPLTQVVPKQSIPLAEKPAFHYLVDEAKRSGIKEIIFVTQPGDKNINDYFKPSPEIKETLDKKDSSFSENLKELKEISDQISFSVVVQKKPDGNGNALLKVKKKIGKNPFAVLFSDDIVSSEKPAISQLAQTFKTSQKPVLGLKQLPEDKISDYGVVEVEKIARRLFKIKGIKEKPSVEEAPSNLAVFGRFILTPEIFEYLEDVSVDSGKEKTIYDGLFKMKGDGKVIYGFEVNGEWLDCGTKIKYLKANLYHCLNHPEYGEELRKYIDKLK